MPPTKEIALLRRYRTAGDEAARDQLVEQMLPLVRRIALRYANRGQDLDDLIQVGSVGLLKAIDRFQFGRGTRLATYAEPTILGEIKRHFRDHGWMVRPPRDLQELHAKVSRAHDDLPTQLKRSPTIAEIAEHIGVSVEDVLEALRASASYESAPLEDESGATAESWSLVVDDPSFERAELLSTLRKGMAALSVRDRQVVHLRFFEDLSQREIAQRIGVSQMQVSRILRTALQRVRSELESDVDADRAS
jgi:RNA polymerase sigma-B factor